MIYVRIIRFVFFAILLFFGIQLNGQIRQKSFISSKDTLFLDSIPVSSWSLSIRTNGKVLQSGIDYFLLEGNKAFILNNPQLNDSLLVSYMRYPDWLVAERSHRKPMILTDANAAVINSTEKGKVQNKSEDNISTDGILMRGISFGNAQDLVLNSSLNLRMNGQITKTMSLEAALTDQEFPFQPEGTTTTLQDFDRIYVKLKLPKTEVLLGDHAFLSPANLTFMKYAKKDRGLQFMGKDSLTNGVLSYEVAAALARGRFHRNEINGIEGQQGPYRLQGARGEQFIIIVSGTEVVYLDGKKMERGLQSDYIIDYNTGELTFTPKRIINAYSRIVVEFQYSDRAYTRSVVGANTNLSLQKWNITAAVYSEQDARNQPIQQDLQAFDSSSNQTAKQILQAAGDETAGAVLSSARMNTTFSNSSPNYILLDTGNVKFYQFVELADTHKVFYTITFTYLGAGNGHYILRGNVANGKTYRYVGEINGVPAGVYEPITQLRSPNRISMAESGVRFAPRKGTNIALNASVSANDKNTFSAKNDNDNRGYAIHFHVSDFREFGAKDSVKKWYINSKLDAENTSANFTSIERYREVEFGRQWNRSLYNPENGLNPSGSSYVKASTEIGKKNVFLVLFNGGVNKSIDNLATFGSASMQYNYHHFFVNPLAEISRSILSAGENQFSKKMVDLGYRKKQLSAVFNAQNESSVFENNIGEKGTQSYAFSQAGLNFQNNYKFNSFQLGYSNRVNRDLSQLALINSVKVQNANLEWITKGKKAGFLKVAGSFRSMELLDTMFKNKYATENHLAGRWEYNFSKIAKIFSGNLYYQTISGREQQRQYSYFEVPAGQGYFAWIDFNSNGVKEVNEFQETPFKDQAKYIRLLVPTGTYIKAQNTDFNGNLVVSPTWKKGPKMTNRTTWSYAGKSTEINWIKRIAPFLAHSDILNILAMNAFVRNQLELETRDGNYLLQYTGQTRSNKAVLTTGFDMRNSNSHIVFFRGNIGSHWQVKNALEKRNSNYSSQFLPQNNFEYIYWGAEPALTWQPNSKFRVTVSVKSIANRNANGKVADLLENGLQFTKTIGKAGILDVKVSSLKASYYLAQGTPLSYDVLQGFSAGQNFRGTADLRFSASKNIQMVISYEGRKTASAAIIHIGRAEARYLF